jgi:hypothetical protein
VAVCTGEGGVVVVGQYDDGKTGSTGIGQMVTFQFSCRLIPQMDV